MIKEIKLPKAIIFDMDGVITNTMPYHYKAWRQVLRSAGIQVTKLDIYGREGQDGLTSMKGIFETYHHPFHAKEARALLNAKEELFKKIVRRRFVKGALIFIRKLKKSGVLLALVTGTSRHETCKILHKDVVRFFDASVTGDEVRNGKPHPEPFLKALKILGIKAGDALVIENAPFGIEAAKRAGLFCIALETSLPREYLRKADVVVPSYQALRLIIRV
ncbi:MAG TPA: HAD-IA family hydrolase [Candidatus Omnitrophota bacterium]|nr:HAD-IA family hydrolase [Candidatus Omnitrophota bacterium]